MERTMSRLPKTVSLIIILALFAMTVDPILGHVIGRSVPFLNMRLAGDLFHEVIYRAVILLVVAGVYLAPGMFMSRVKLAEEEAKHLNGKLETVRSIIGFTIRETDVEPLVAEACEQLISTRNYEKVWIGIFDGNGGLAAAAEAGWGEEFDALRDAMRNGKRPTCARSAITQPDPVVFQDPVAECGDCPLKPKHYGRGNLIVRIAAGDKTYGVLCVSAPPHTVGDDEEKSLLLKVAWDLGMTLRAIELERMRSRTADELESERKSAEALARLTDAVVACDAPVHEIAESVLAHAMATTGSSEGVVWMLDPRTGEPIVQSSNGLPSSSSAAFAQSGNETGEAETGEAGPPPADTSPSGRYPGLWTCVLETSKTLRTNEPQLSDEWDGVTGTASPISSFLGVPAVAAGHLLGVIAVANSSRGYTPEDEQALERLADIYAAAAQRRLAEQEISVAERAVDNSLDPAVIADDTGAVVRVNDAFLKTWNYSEVPQVLGVPVGRFLVNQQAVSEMLNELKADGRWAGDLEAKHSDGSSFPVSASATVATDQSGKTLALAFSFVDETERRTSTLEREIVRAVSAKAGSSEDMHELYRTVRQQLGKLIDTRNFFVALYDEETERIDLPLFLDEKDQNQFETLPPGKTLTGHVVRTRAPLLATEEDVARMVTTGEIEVVGTPCKSWLGVPLLSPEGAIGAIAVQSYTDARAFGEDSVDLMCDIAAVVATAVSRNEAEGAKRHGDGRFNAIAETSNDALINVDSRGKIIFWNKSAENMFGYTPDEAVGQSFSLVVPEGFLQAHVDGLMRAVSADGQGYVRANVEGIGLRKDESEFPMELSIGAWKSNNDTFFTAVIRDITSRKQAEEELQFLGSIPLQVSDALIVTDLNFRVTYVNKAAEYLYGYPGGELVGKTLDVLSAEPWGDDFQDEIHRTVSSGRVWSGGRMNRRKDGSTFLVEFRVSPLRDRQGRLSSYISIFHDMTERKRAEQLLQTLNAAALGMERHLTADQILEAVADELERVGLSCAVLMAYPGRSEVTLSYVSKSVVFPEADEYIDTLAVAGVPVSANPADPIRRVTRERQAIFIEGQRGAVGGKSAASTWEEGDGLADMLYAERSILAPLIAGEDVIGVLAVRSGELTRKDSPAITAFANQLAAALRKANLMQELENSLQELKRTQDILLHAQKMEAIGNLAGGVAHDFNNLLTAITGYAELVLRRVEEGDPTHSDVSQIKKVGEQAAALTGQLLAFSRRQPLQKKVLCLNDVISNTDKMLRRLIGEDVELVVNLDGALREVKADSSQIEQVIMNLAINSRDAMPGGGTLTIRTENVALGEEDCQDVGEATPGEYARIIVRDTGEGIDQAVVDRIFEPFFSTKEAGKGTGLGLSVVYGIVAQHGGWIGVSSEIGEGTTFEVYMPVTNDVTEEEPVAEVAMEKILGHGERILLVEDEDNVRDFARRALCEGGYEVLEATSAEEALDIFENEERKVDLIFSDVVLPAKSGLQLVEELLSVSPELHVLLSSGYTDQKSQWSVIDERGLAFLPKPYDISELLRTIRETIEPI
jgi:PAS domain S-box-containing protein